MTTALLTPQGIILTLGAVVTLALYSILYRENPVYRMAEHIFLGLATGFGLYAIWAQVLFPIWFEPMKKEGIWWWALVLIPGMMYYTIYSKRLSWMSRLVMMVMLGFESGLIFRVWAGRYMPQIADSFRPLIPPPGSDLLTPFDNAIFLITLTCVMVYFLFSFERKNVVVNQAAGLGRWLMMIAFGAMFGSTVMARMSLFIGRLWFLAKEWIPYLQTGGS